VRPTAYTFLLACTVLSGARPAWAQAGLLDPITRAQGSPSDYVFDLLQDRAGFLWMATDAGLVRYDGRDFVTWTTAEGLPHNYVNALHERPDGSIVAGTYQGAAVLSHGRLTRLPDTHASVSTFAEDRFGRLYLASASGVEVCERGRCRLLLRGRPAGEGRFVASSGGTLRLPMFGNVVAVVRPSATNVTASRETIEVPAGQMLIALGPDGSRFLLTRGGGLTVTTAAGQVRVHLPTAQIRSLYAPPRGDLLIGSETGDVWRFGARRIIQVARSTDMGTYAVHALMRDYEGNLWGGLFGGGARRLDESAVSRPPDLDPRLARSILRLSRDRNGTAWMTTREGLVSRTAAGVVQGFGGSALVLTTDHPAAGRYVASSTSIYWAMPGGQTRPLLFDGNWFSSLLLGPGDTLWAGTYGSGLRRIVGTREVARPAPGGPPVVEALVAGAHGAVWALTRSEGAFRYAQGRWTNVREGLPSGAVFSLLDEPDGTLWIGTDRGLVRRRGTQRRLFDDGGRLRGQRLHALFRTGDTLWAVADRMLYGVVRDTLRTFGRVRLRRDDGTAIHAAVPVPEARRILLGTSDGLVEVDLRSSGIPLPAPRVAFLGLPETGTAPRDTIRLPRGQRSVSLAFAPLTFGSAGAGRLQHRISRGAWSEPTAERAVALAGLGDGWHTLDVRAVNVEGRASAQPVRVTLFVPPPWWRTWPARALGLLLLVAAAAALARWISTRRLRTRLQALETEQHIQRERDRISRDLHDHVGAQLTGVLAGLELLGDEAPASGGLVAALRDEVRETMGALRTAIFTLQHPPASFDELGLLFDRYVRDQARFRAAPLLRCTVEGQLARPLDPFEALHLFRIAQEGLQNAIRHAGATRVTVRLAGEGEALVLTVEDDGVFRAPDGTGHGLAAMRARAGEIGAALSVEAGAHGTTVRVAWPGKRTPGEIIRMVDAPTPEAIVP